MTDAKADLTDMRDTWNAPPRGPSWLSQTDTASLPSLMLATYMGAVAMVAGRRLYWHIEPGILEGERFTTAFAFTGDVALGLALTFVLLTWLRMRHVLHWVTGYAGLAWVLFGEHWIAVYMPRLYAMLFSESYVTIAMNVPSRGHELVSHFF
ncbi:MAG: hypothetical protein ACU0CO_18535 [Shimia sp.]